MLKAGIGLINKRVQVILIAVVILLLLSGCGDRVRPDDGHANRGLIDLRDADLSRSAVRLNGEWEFYWRQLLAPTSDHDWQADQPMYIRLPHSWNGYDWEGEKLPGQGYATFRLRLLLNEQYVGQIMALRLPTIFHAYQLWIDGVPHIEVGQVGTDRDSTMPSLATQLVYFQPQANEVELVLQVANFHHMRGGITKPIELGSGQLVSNRTILKTAYEIFVTASLFIIGAYHILLYLHRRKDATAIYFGLFTIMWGTRSLLVGEVLLTRMFPNFPWGIQIKIEYLVLYAGIHIFTLYFYHLFQDIAPRWLRLSSRYLAILFSIIVLVTPASVYTRTLLMYEIIIAIHMIYFVYSLIRAFLRRQEGAGLFLVVSLITFASVLNDFLYYNEVSPIGNTSNLGLLIFTIAQMYLLSSRFAKAVSNEEKAARELASANEQLQEINRSLEQKVEERTRELSLAHDDLQHAYERLLQSEEGRKKLLSYLTHDLKTPLSSMIGYVEALQDNVRPEKQATYLKYVYDRAIWLNRMIEDLSLLSSLETGQIAMHKRPILIEPFIRQFWEKYELVLEEAGLKGEMHVDPAFHSANPPLVHVDPMRLEQVLANLLSNAMKFTPTGGAVRLSLDLQEGSERQVMICLSDTGIGIEREHLERIFERHFKRYPVGVDRDRSGSGLGLAISKEIVELHDGKIWAESNGRDGSSFWIELPAMKES
jgi:signal transduction histidine kinase